MDAKNGETHPEDQITKTSASATPANVGSPPTLKCAPPLIVIVDMNVNANRTQEWCLSTLSQMPACVAQHQQTADGEDLVGTWWGGLDIAW